MPNRTFPVQAPGRAAVEALVREHMDHLVSDVAPTAFDVAGDEGARNEAWPAARRGASRLSPVTRYGLLPLPTVWDHVAGGPRRDVAKYRDELRRPNGGPIQSFSAWRRSVDRASSS